MFEKLKKKTIQKQNGKKEKIFFDINLFLDANPQVQEEIKKGKYVNLEHYLEAVDIISLIENGEIKFHAFYEPFEEQKYLKLSLDVNAEVINGIYKSGFEHFKNYGYKEIITGTRFWNKVEEIMIIGFDEASFLHANKDVEVIINNGIYIDLSHYLETDGFSDMQKGLRPFHKDFKPFNELIYIEQDSYIKDAVEEGNYKSGYDHFCRYGYLEIIKDSRFWEKYSKNIYPIKKICQRFEDAKESNILINSFNEDEYLKVNIFVQKAIDCGEFNNVNEHLKTIGLKQIENGLRKFHTKYKAFDETRYLQLYPDVRKIQDESNLSSGFEHFCKIGYCEIINELRIWK